MAGGGVYRTSAGMWSADLQMLRRKGPIGKRGECIEGRGHYMAPVGAIKPVK